MQNTEFTIGQIHPIECVKEAWVLIKDEYWILFAVSIVGAMIGGVSMYVLIGAMICGIFTVYLKKIDGGRVVFDDLWKGFKLFWPSLPLTLVMVVPIVVLMIVMFVTVYLPIITSAVMGSKANENAILGTFLVGVVVELIMSIIMITIHSLLVFAFPLLVDRQMSSWEAMKLSARASLKNIGGITGLIVVNMGFGLAGAVTCGLGMYLLIPIITATTLVAYRKVFPSLNPMNLNPPPPTAYSEI